MHVQNMFLFTTAGTTPFACSDGDPVNDIASRADTTCLRLGHVLSHDSVQDIACTFGEGELVKQILSSAHKLCASACAALCGHVQKTLRPEQRTHVHARAMSLFTIPRRKLHERF